MTGLIDVAIDDWRLISTVDGLPGTYEDYVEHAILSEEFDLKEPEGDICFLGISQGHRSWPSLVIAQRYDPAAFAGFNPGALIVSRTSILFVGGGTRLLAYDLRKPCRKWQRRTEIGFLSWTRHGAYVLMSAELELAAWTLEGTMLWSRFVEPPWDYAVRDDTVHLDVMGTKSSFNISSGP